MTNPASDLRDRALLPLRAFLGVTFCFAGLQKLANHGFFDARDPASIQAQLAAAARRSPIHWLVTPLEHVGVALGVLIALGELAVGVGTLLGLWSRLAAAGGVALSVMLFLTVSFHSSPYYTGSDIVFAFAWTPLLLAGAGVWSLDALLAARAEAARRGKEAKARRVSRREAGAITAAVAVGTLVIGGLTAAIGRLANGSTTKTASGTALPTPAAAQPAQPTSSATGRAPIAAATAIPVGSAQSFTDPASGDPALILHSSPGTFLAFDAVCPHAGCTVQYDASAGLLVCPCHGSQFNASTGAVEVGPATSGLRPIQVTRGPENQLYAS